MRGFQEASFGKLYRNKLKHLVKIIKVNFQIKPFFLFLRKACPPLPGEKTYSDCDVSMTTSPTIHLSPLVHNALPSSHIGSVKIFILPPMDHYLEITCFCIGHFH
jgi:hypothetical protein